jgi:hypothetical protein
MFLHEVRTSSKISLRFVRAVATANPFLFYCAMSQKRTGEKRDNADGAWWQGVSRWCCGRGGASEEHHPKMDDINLLCRAPGCLLILPFGVSDSAARL